MAGSYIFNRPSTADFTPKAAQSIQRQQLGISGFTTATIATDTLVVTSTATIASLTVTSAARVQAVVATSSISGTSGTITNTWATRTLAATSAVSGQSVAATSSLTGSSGGVTNTWAANTVAATSAVTGQSVTLTSAINKLFLTEPATGATVTVANGKTATISNTITFSGTDGTTMTFPATNATIARTDAANTFTGTQTFNGAVNIDAGTVGLPGLYLEGETTSGLYRIGANNHGYAISGAKVLDIASTGLGVTGTLTATGLMRAGGAGAPTGSVGVATLNGIQTTNTGNGGFALIPKVGGGVDSYTHTGAVGSETYTLVTTTTSTGLAVTGTLSATSTITTLGGATFHTTSSALTNGAGVGAGTLLTAPAAGNPTKWIGINDNGTTRYIPAW